MALKAMPAWLIDAADALEYAISKGAKVSSNSYGGYGIFNGFKNILDNNPQHIFVCSAGNNELLLSNDVTYSPCSTNPSSNLLCVGATDKYDQKSSFSNYGTDHVHVFAPGSKIASCGHRSTNSYVYEWGTRYVFSTNLISMNELLKESITIGWKG